MLRAQTARERRPPSQSLRWTLLPHSTYRTPHSPYATGNLFKPVESTTLIADIALGEAPGEDEHANLLEVGLTHQFNDAVEIGVGIAAGLDDDSPDFVAHADIEFKFGGPKSAK